MLPFLLLQKKTQSLKTVIKRLHFLSKQYFYNIDSRCPTFIIKINKNTQSIRIALEMLNKYQEFFKLSKTDQCSIYSAVSKQTNQPVLLKKFQNKDLTWDQILKSRNMQLSQKSKMFPKMIQIFRNKADYYIVYERPNGHSFHQINSIGKLVLQDFYILFDDLCKYVREIRNMLPTVYIVPQWIFMHRHTVRLIHFEPFFLSREMLNSDHVYLYKVQNQIISPEDESNQMRPNNEQYTSLVTSDHRRNIIYTLAIIAYYLLTGTQKKQNQTQAEYQIVLIDIQLNAEKRITKITKDKALGHLISKMLIAGHGQDLQLLSSKGIGSHSQEENAFKRLKLQNSPEVQQPQVRRRLRPCCAQKEASIEKINEQNRRLRDNRELQHKQLYHSRLYQHEQLPKSQKVTIKKSIFLPSIQKKGHRRIKTSVDLMNTTNSKPLMFGNGPSFIKP